jgi:signal transduction histidine kinase
MVMQSDVSTRDAVVCAIAEDEGQLVAAAAAFLQRGLARGERCVYVAEAEPADELLQALSAGGVDVGREREAGALVVVRTDDAHLRSGSFDPHAMIAFLDATAKKARADGFPGIRFAGDMSWAARPGSGSERLIEYEAMLEEFFARSEASGLCLYQRECFAPDVVYGLLRTHPVAILGDELCPNPFHEPPEMVVGDASAGERVNWAIAQLRRVRAAQARVAEEARESVAASDAFLSVAVHELRTPLTSVKANAQLLERALQGGAVDAVRLERLVGAVVAATDRLVGLTGDLLDVTRVRTGQLALRLEVVDLSRLVEQAIARHWAAMDGSHRLTVDLPGDPCHVRVDPSRIDEVVENLLGNAAKYSPAGGPVWLSLHTDAGSAHLVVRDEGIGLPPGSEEAIFQPFGRAANATRARVPGLGLGLHICRGIVGAHGGRMWAESEGEGRGTTMHVVLPCETPSTD